VTRRVWFHLGWALLAAGSITLDTLSRASTDPGAWVWPFGMVTYPIAGALILIHRPRNRVGALFTVVGVTAGVFSLAYWVALTWLDAPLSPHLEAVGIPGFAVTYWGLIALLYLFPVGTAIPGWRTWLFRVFTAVTLGILPFVAVMSTEFLDEAGSGRPNPFHVGGLSLDGIFNVSLLFLAVGAFGGISSLVNRFRRSAGVERAQMKMFLSGAVAFVVIVGFAVTSPESESASDPLWIYGLVMAAFTALPASVTAGILRYRLYDIDRLISRTLAYTVVVAAMVGIFLGVVSLLTSLLPAESDLAVAASTLAVAAMFNPLRRRIHSAVDRRFNRSKYDAEAEIDALSARLRDAHEIDGITEEMLGVVARTLQPSSVGVWMTGGRP
jgi:hypothetical protein